MIESQNNAKIAAAAKLKDKKFRAESGLYLVEGVKMVREALALKLPVRTVFLREGEPLEGYPQEITELVSARAFQKLADTVTPQGVVATVEIPQPRLLPPEGDCLILDGISDAGNLGTILRTAAASGFDTVYLADCADPYNPKCVRSSMGGIFYVTAIAASREEIAEQAAGCELVAADMSGNGLFEERFGKTALIIGSEAHGVSPFFRERAARTVRVPIERVESLNAAVCAGIMMYAIKNRKKEMK